MPAPWPPRAAKFRAVSFTARIRASLNVFSFLSWRTMPWTSLLTSGGGLGSTAKAYRDGARDAEDL